MRTPKCSIMNTINTCQPLKNWKMIAGNPRTALTRSNTIVLTKSTAQKFFGNTTPVGKTLRIDNNESFEVTGVMEDVPSNSHDHLTRVTVPRLNIVLPV
jgi:putative ABC transport system permease protein